MIKQLNFLFILMSLLIVACNNDDVVTKAGENKEEIVQGEEENTCDDITTDFKSDIMPIIAANCAIQGCHVDVAGDRPDFSKESIIVANASRIKRRSQQGTMPPEEKLSIEFFLKLACWADGLN